MYKIFNLLLIAIILLFFFNIYNYYSSNKNIKNINLNRSNIEKIVRTKISNIPILEDDTNNVIEFNSSFSEKIKDNKKRSFWNLLKME
tara:strand:- start:2405 stop:2668 length:264 start_codon:yes stop_codon:yes gene_type:complete